MQLPSAMASSPTNAAASDKPNKDALAFIDFVNASPTPFHAVAVGARKLEAAGFVRLPFGPPACLVDDPGS